MHAAAGGAVVPEADQQVAAQADQLPADEERQHVVGQHDQQHAEGEQGQIGEETAVARVEMAVLDHVRARIHVHQEADHRDHDEHDRGEWVNRDAQSEEGLDRALGRVLRQEPQPLDFAMIGLAGQGLRQDHEQRQEHGDADRRDTDGCHDEGEQRQEQDREGAGDHRPVSVSPSSGRAGRPGWCAAGGRWR